MRTPSTRRTRRLFSGRRTDAAAFGAEKGVILPGAAFAGLCLGDVESAHSSARMPANLVADKKRKQRPAGDVDG